MLSKCLECGFEDHIEDADFCENCGAGLFNICSNEDCDIDGMPNELRQTAKFCNRCGEPSIFKIKGYFDEK